MMIKKLHVFIFIFLAFCSAAVYGQQQKFELKKITFNGNSSFSSQQLFEIIGSKQSAGWFSKFLGSFTFLGSKPVYFDSLNVPLDAGLLKNYYQSKGYFRVKIKPSFQLDKKEGTAELVFNIKEGKPFYYRSFDVKGTERLPIELQEFLQSGISIDTTEQYSTELIQSKIEYIKEYLTNNGYMDAVNSMPDVYLDTVKNKVDVKINFKTGNRFKISDVKVRKIGPGKDLISDDLIKDIFSIKNDTYYNQFEITKAQLRLWRTNLFDSLALNHSDIDTINNYVPIEIIGKITSLHELSPEVIANNEDDEFNLGLALSFVKKNFLGDARKMTITATAATKNFTQLAYTDLRSIFEQPYLFGSLIRPKFEAYYTNQLRLNEYQAYLYGGKLNLDFEAELTLYTVLTSFSVYFNWEHSRYIYQTQWLLDRYGITKDQVSAISAGDSTIISGDNAIIGFALGRDKTNRTNFPTEGYSTSLILEDGNSILYLSHKLLNTNFDRPLYFKSVFSLSQFNSLWDSKTSTLGIKLKFGSIMTYKGDKTNIPINQRFYCGGSNSIRGWKSQELVPGTGSIIIGQNISSEDLEALKKLASPGGFIMFEGTFEFRAKWSDWFGSAVFVDYGNTWNEVNDISLKTVAVSTGIGFRIYPGIIPPIRFDFGFKLYNPFTFKWDVNKRIGNLFSENLEIQFGIGEAF